jgi:hypothetical protein
MRFLQPKDRRIRESIWCSSDQRPSAKLNDKYLVGLLRTISTAITIAIVTFLLACPLSANTVP